MRGFVGITDNDWFAFLFQQPGIDEANFWQPSADVSFRARQKHDGQAFQQSEPFLFKLLNVRSNQEAH